MPHAKDSAKHDGSSRPDLTDLMIEVYGRDELHREGLVQRVKREEEKRSILEMEVAELKREIDTWVERVKWLLIGLGLNLAAVLPRVIGWFIGGNE